MNLGSTVMAHKTPSRPGAGPPLDAAESAEESASELTDSAEQEFLRRVARGAEGDAEIKKTEGEQGLYWASPRFEIKRRIGEGGFGAV